jgi:hypothetical protein
MPTITLRIHRVQTTTIDLAQPLDPTRDLEQQLNDAGAWPRLSARVHRDSVIASISVIPAPIPVYPGEPYVVLEGGLVNNDPLLPVFDLDVLKSGYIDEHEIGYATSLAEQAREHGLTEIATRLDRFLADR